MPRDELKTMLGKGDVFVSQDLQTSTLFGDYRVDGAVMNVTGYNDFLTRLTRRIGQALSQPLPKGNKIAAHLANPYLQVNTAELAVGWRITFVSDCSALISSPWLTKTGACCCYSRCLTTSPASLPWR